MTHRQCEGENELGLSLQLAEEWKTYQDRSLSQPADTLGTSPFGTDHVLMHNPLFRRYNLFDASANIDARSQLSRLQVRSSIVGE